MTAAHPVAAAPAADGLAMPGAGPGPLPAADQVTILGTAVDRMDFAGLLAALDGWLAAWRTGEPRAGCRQVCTVNPEFIVDARQDGAFATVLARADLRVPDGVGVLWAAGLLGKPLHERVTGSDGIYRIAERAAARGWRVFLLGAQPGVAAAAADVLRARYPGLTVVGAYSGSPDAAGWPAIAGWLASTQPDVLFVAYGHPKQDFWIDRHRGELPVGVAIGVGGAFDFVAGVAVRAPLGLQRLGLEWLHRLWREPWRWRRMAKLPWFALLVLWQRAVDGKA